MGSIAPQRCIITTYAALSQRTMYYSTLHYRNTILSQRRIIATPPYLKKYILINIYKRNGTKAWEEEGKGR